MENIIAQITVWKNFLQIFICVLNNPAPQKKKYNRGNMSFTNKSITQAHIKRNRLRNQLLKHRPEVNRINCIRQTKSFEKNQKIILRKSK